METSYYLNDKPVTILESAPRGQVWVETADGREILVHKAGLHVNTGRTIQISQIKVDPTRGTDGAR